jgi:hypothetical protein
MQKLSGKKYSLALHLVEIDLITVHWQFGTLSSHRIVVAVVLFKALLK